MTLKGKTTSGFKYEIDEGRLTNYELVEALAEEGENPLAMVKIVKLLLGDQTEKLKEHVRDEKGFVSIEKIGQEIKEIFESHKQVKN